MNKRIVILGILLIAALPLLAQDDFPRGQVFGGYSYVSADTSGGLSGRQSLNGWNAQGSVNFNKWLGLTADFGGYYGSPSGVTIHDYSFLFGPTLTIGQNTLPHSSTRYLVVTTLTRLSWEARVATPRLPWELAVVSTFRSASILGSGLPRWTGCGRNTSAPVRTTFGSRPA